MRKIKTINEHLIVQFNDLERRKDKTLGRYGIIKERLYTGALKADRDAMDFDGIDTLEEAVELAREAQRRNDQRQSVGPAQKRWRADTIPAPSREQAVR